MGQALLLYHSRVQREFLTPLRAFLEVDVKNVMVREGVCVCGGGGGIDCSH